MTRREVLKSLFPEVQIGDDACAYIRCQHIGRCNTCKYFHYWDEPAIFSNTAVKSILNSTYGVNAQHLELIKEGWEKLPSIHNNIEWGRLNNIINDALDNGFEVRILNGTIYYKEKQ